MREAESFPIILTFSLLFEVFLSITSGSGTELGRETAASEVAMQRWLRFPHVSGRKR